MPLEKLGPYRLEKLLGRGGMGAVYAGVNEQTGERAAVKVLAAHLSDNPDFRVRFTGEVETLKKLKHPNIVQLLAYGEEGEHLFYVMELIDGTSLQDELVAGRRFNWREVAKYGVEVCRALKHAHDSGVVHRDLKPANLLLDRQNQVKLTDFGIAKLYGGTNITAAGGVLGTADYMSPEQAEGKPVNHRSDLYSLGSVLYALLVGHPPFDAKSLAEVIHKLRYEKPTPVRRLAPDTPEAFDRIILQLLEKDPGDRIPSAFALGNYLRAMEHALSLETQVGQPAVDDLPIDTPVTPHTQASSGNDMTLVTGVPSAPQDSLGLTEAGGVTSKLGDSTPDYRLSGADVATVAPRSDTQAAPPSSEVADTTAPKSRFVTIEEEEAVHRRRKRRDEDGTPTWALLLGMAVFVCLLCGVIVYAILPPSANALYATISAAAESGEREKLQGVDDEVSQFLDRFPEDPRAEEVQQYRDTLDVAKRERQLELKARLGGGSQAVPAEQAYQEAVRLAETDPEKAIARFEAIVAVFGSGELEEKQRTQVSIELAKQQVEKLTAAIEESSKMHRKLIESRLKEADALKETSPEEASRIYQGIVELYGDKAWAKDLVARAEQELE